jgi:hypothetical protein
VHARGEQPGGRFIFIEGDLAMTQEELLEAINEFSSDTSRSKQSTLDGLNAASEELAGLIESLEGDMDDEGE